MLVMYVIPYVLPHIRNLTSVAQHVSPMTSYHFRCVFCSGCHGDGGGQQVRPPGVAPLQGHDIRGMYAIIPHPGKR